MKNSKHFLLTLFIIVQISALYGLDYFVSASKAPLYSSEVLSRDNMTQTVFDPKLQLLWQDDEDCKNEVLTYYSAKEYCNSKEDGFRLPTLGELQSIVDTSNFNPSIKDGFYNTAPDWYWTKKNEYIEESESKMINFKNGAIDHENFDRNKVHIRCVSEIKK